jgi:hypothetical protein
MKGLEEYRGNHFVQSMAGQRNGDEGGAVDPVQLYRDVSQYIFAYM